MPLDRIDAFRARDFRRLDAGPQVYLDYTGGSLYAESHVRRHLELLLQCVLGNPHSGSPASSCASDLVAAARTRVLRFFNAPAAEYAVVFTANATHALKLVGESYPFAPGGRYLMTFDNHNSVNGIREFARARGAAVTYVPLQPSDMRTADADIESALASPAAGARRLFAYPAQSNFSGVQHPLEWIAAARGRGWDVLLDAAAFTATNRLDLARWRPDFVSLSFYKMFGYPTGIGALVARHEALEVLRRPWFSGGTISVASVSADRYFLAAAPAAFEDGTVDYASLPAVTIGLDLLDEVGIDTVHARVGALTARLLDRLLGLRHRTGHPLVAVYGPTDAVHRGGTVAMNFYDPDGHFVDHAIIERRAGARRISIRSGCFCNPGAGEVALDLPAERLADCFDAAGRRFSHEDLRRCVDDRSSGAVRASLGWISNAADVDAFVAFAEDLLDRPASAL